MVTFFLDRLSITSFGLATAVLEFSQAASEARVVARTSDDSLGARMTLPQVSLAAAMTDGKSSLWHVNDMFAPFCLGSVVIGVLCGKTVMICPHGMLDPWALHRRSYKRKRVAIGFLNFLARFGSIVIHALNSDEARAANRLLPNCRDVCIVPNGVPADILAYIDRPDRRARTGQEVNVGMLSRISEKKNQVAMIELARKIRERNPEAFSRMRFFIDGAVEDDEYGRHIVSLIGEYELGSRIALRGNVEFENRASVIDEYDIFFFPSHSEGMAYVVLEAMALGKYLIVSAESNSDFVSGYGGLVYSNLDDVVSQIPWTQEQLSLCKVDSRRVVVDFGLEPLKTVFDRYSAVST